MAAHLFNGPFKSDTASALLHLSGQLLMGSESEQVQSPHSFWDIGRVSGARSVSDTQSVHHTSHTDEESTDSVESNEPRGTKRKQSTGPKSKRGFSKLAKTMTNACSSCEAKESTFCTSPGAAPTRCKACRTSQCGVHASVKKCSRCPAIATHGDVRLKALEKKLCATCAASNEYAVPIASSPCSCGRVNQASHKCARGILRCRQCAPNAEELIPIPAKCVCGGSTASESKKFGGILLCKNACGLRPVALAQIGFHRFGHKCSHPGCQNKNPRYIDGDVFGMARMMRRERLARGNSSTSLKDYTIPTLCAKHVPRGGLGITSWHICICGEDMATFATTDQKKARYCTRCKPLHAVPYDSISIVRVL